MTLHLSDFGGGVALVGSADVQRTDELQACDSYDIGERGQLIVASDLSALSAILGLSPMYGCALTGSVGIRQMWVIGIDGAGPLWQDKLDAVFAVASTTQLTAAPLANGYVCTFATFPFVNRLGQQMNPMIVCIAAREGKDPRTGRVLQLQGQSGGWGLTIGDWLGTGSGQQNEAVAGTKAKDLYPRGVAAYNNHLMLWGFDNKDAAAGDGVNRLMFSNVGNPTKIGNDPGPAGVDRDFLDTDAINIGAAGEIIRAGYPWAGKFWIGTNRELHYLAGFGRESFITNGTVGIRKSRNVCGPNSMIEGPDGLLYGVSTEGLWGFDGASVESIYRRVVDFRGKSLGWWDLIWQDAARADAYPGKTNQDLVWMLADPETMQVLIVIPWCNAAAGYGYGTDTVVIKYHVQTGGFTRQLFIGKQLTHGTLLRREPGQPTRRLFLDSQVPGSSVKQYGVKADASVSPILPTSLPDVTFGEYAPFSPDEEGLTRRVYVTISIDNAAALPIVFLASPFIDGEALGAVKVSIQATAPGAPANGDMWLDTSGTDQNLGTGVAGALVIAAGDYVYKRWMTGWAKWVIVPEGGGELGNRMTFPIAFRGLAGDRLKMRLQTTALAGRYQIEGIGLDPARQQ